MDRNRKLGREGWRRAKADGVEYAFLRATYEQWADPLVEQETDDALAEGVIVGYYAFLVPGAGHPSPEQQVRIAADVVGKLGPGYFPIALDFEYPHGVAGTGMSRRDLLLWNMRAVDAAVAIWGVDPFGYSSKRVIDDVDSDSLDATHQGLDLARFSRCLPWLARYPWAAGQRPQLAVDGLAWPPVPSCWGDAGNVFIHQYQGDTRGFSAFSSTVDLNRFRVLSPGDHGRRVVWCQKRLGAAAGAADGDFGPKTRAALLTFQAERQLPATGQVDPATLAHLAWVVPA